MLARDETVRSICIRGEYEYNLTTGVNVKGLRLYLPVKFCTGRVQFFESSVRGLLHYVLLLLYFYTKTTLHNVCLCAGIIPRH